MSAMSAMSTTLPFHCSPAPNLNALPTELLRHLIALLDPPALLALASTSAHLRTTILSPAQTDLLQRECRRWRGWWWRPVVWGQARRGGTPAEQTYATLCRIVEECACPVCRCIPSPTPTPSPTPSSGSSSSSEAAAAAAQIKRHILPPHRRACKSCLHTHPSYALISAHTAMQRYGLEAGTLRRIARSAAVHEDGDEEQLEKEQIGAGTETGTGTVRSRSVRNSHRHKKRTHPRAPRRVKLYLVADIDAYLRTREQQKR
ncbi:hypothetical protein OC844_001538 [Tilletia horrida]|nr:hypothetical protein OC844_001538 [Tilletia horrida]